ncbi:MAG: sulfotransferase family protein [Planctomycetota bacterium]|jgi:hypothetical protein
MGQRIGRPILVVCAGRSGSTMYYRLIARHRDVGFLSSWHQAFPRLTWLAVFSRLYGTRVLDRVKHNYWFPKPFAPYRFWDRYLPGIARHDRPLVPEDVPEASIEPLRRTIERVMRYQGRTRLLMKVTGWARMAYFARVFPDIRFLYLKRRPISVVASWLKAGWLNVTGEIDGEGWEWGNVPDRYRRIYRNLGGGGVLSAAIKTQLDIDDIGRNVALFPGRCYELNYEDLVLDPCRYFRETLEFCELEWDAAFERVIEGAGIRNFADRWKQQIPAQEATRIQAFFDRVAEEQAGPAVAAAASFTARRPPSQRS